MTQTVTTGEGRAYLRQSPAVNLQKLLNLLLAYG